MSRNLKVKSAKVDQTGVLTLKFSDSLNINTSEVNNQTLFISLLYQETKTKAAVSYDVISVSGNTI